MRAAPLRAALVVLAVAGAAGCGRRADLLGSLPGGATSDGAVADRSGDGFFPRGPRFGPPQLVVALSDPGTDEDPTFRDDLLEMFFSSTRAGTRDIWTSRRASVDEAWGPPSPVLELSSPSFDAGPAVSLDGLTIWLSTDRDLSRGRLWRATRASRAAAWNAPQPLIELATPAFDAAPAVDATQTLMFFASNRQGSGGSDIYFSTRAVPGAPWGPPSPLAGVNTPFEEYDPFVAQGGLVIFYTSTRAGDGDLFWSARRSIESPFPPPLPLVDLNSGAFDSDASLSPDLLYIMFSSARTGNSEIYESRAITD